MTTLFWAVLESQFAYLSLPACVFGSVCLRFDFLDLIVSYYLSVFDFDSKSVN